MEKKTDTLSNHRLFSKCGSLSPLGVSSVARQNIRKIGYRHTLLSALLPCIFVSTVSAQILINEVDADQASRDNAEFVELFDGGNGNTALNNLVLVFFNGSNNAVYRAFDLDGFSTNSAGYFVLCGNNQNVAHCDNDVSPNANLIQNGAEAIALYTGDKTDFPNGTSPTTSNLIDAIVYKAGPKNNTALLSLLIPNQRQVNENGRRAKTEHSNQRCPNGSGGARRTDTYDQFLPTPGTKNICGVTVNTAPITMGSIEDLTLTVGESVTLDVSQYFSDPGDTLTYTATSSNPAIATVKISGGIITMSPK